MHPKAAKKHIKEKNEACILGFSSSVYLQIKCIGLFFAYKISSFPMIFDIICLLVCTLCPVQWHARRPLSPVKPTYRGPFLPLFYVVIYFNALLFCLSISASQFSKGPSTLHPTFFPFVCVIVESVFPFILREPGLTWANYPDPPYNSTTTILKLVSVVNKKLFNQTKWLKILKKCHSWYSRIP